MEFTEFMETFRNKGLRIIKTNYVLYIACKEPSKKIILMRWGTTLEKERKLLCYIDIRYRKDGSYLDTYCVPLEDVTKERLLKFIEDFKTLSNKGVL